MRFVTELEGIGQGDRVFTDIKPYRGQCVLILSIWYDGIFVLETINGMRFVCTRGNILN